MFNPRNRIFLLAFASLVSLLFNPSAWAQCAGGLPESQQVSVEAGNPFQADYSKAITPDSPALQVFEKHGAQSVARDSQGRVRIDHFLNMVKAKAPDGTVSEVERHIITICDPNYQRPFQLDTADKTARMFTLRPVPAGRAALGDGKQQSFCTRYFSVAHFLHRIDSVDLGHRDIEGFDAHGVRSTMISQSSQKSELKPIESTEEEWCSDELGAIVQRVSVTKMGSGQQITIGFVHIKRTEPDPTLFEIPSDYTILEDVPDEDSAPMAHPVASPSHSDKQ